MFSPKKLQGNEPWRCLLQTYLRNVLSPACTSLGLPLGDRPKEGSWRTEPEETASVCASDSSESNALAIVSSPRVYDLDIWDFRTMVRNYLDGSPDCFITEHDKPFMDIPCYGVTSLNPSQVDFLSRVNTQDDFMLLIMKFMLGPVTHCCRILNNIPRNAPMARSLEFIALRGPNDAPVVDFDILRIPATSHGEGPLSIICVPPWKLGLEDFRAFSMPSQIPKNNHDPRFKRPSDEGIVNAKDLWRVVLETCAPDGLCFVVTNYLFWCFGKFEADWTTATVSPPVELEMSIPNSTRLPMKTLPTGLGCTVVECLTFWIQMTRGAAPWLEVE